MVWAGGNRKARGRLGSRGAGGADALEARLFAKPPRQHGTWRGVETERWHVARLELLARFFADRAAGRPGASVATGAIGLLGYRTSLAIHDFHGLMDPEIAHLEVERGADGQPLGSGLPGHEKGDPLRVLAKQPTFWMTSRSLRDEPAGWPRYDAEIDERLRSEYRRVEIWLEDEVNHEAGYFTFLERKAASPR